MIVVVDDDEVMVEVSQVSLEDAGFAVRGFTSPAEALLFLKDIDPELIVSDLMMPEMDGFAFRQAYLQNSPERQTPFLFLSSMADPDIIVAGLEQGADDYLLKPIDHRVFTAKVKSLLKKKPAAEPAFHGDLGLFPLNNVMKFCELKGLTGQVDIIGAGVAVTLSCRGGQFDLDELADSSQFEKAFDLSTGSFIIRTRPVDYADILHVQLSSVTPPTVAAPSQELPMGKLSGIKINQRIFQVQSEFVEHPAQQILTMVILDGKVVLKKGTPALLSLGREALQQMIEEQHVAVEQEIQQKIASRMEAKSQGEVSQKERFNILFEEGWQYYRQGEYARALALWGEAREINPLDKAIETNLKIVRKKLGA